MYDEMSLYERYGTIYADSDCPKTDNEIDIEKCWECVWFMKNIDDKIYCTFALQINIEREGLIKQC